MRFTRSIALSVTLFVATTTVIAADAGKPAPAKTEKELNRLIQQLGSDLFKEREQASAELSKLGGTIMTTLKEAIKNPDAEIRRRARQLIEQIEGPILLQQRTRRDAWFKLLL
jgi:hypothetical protein